MLRDIDVVFLSKVHYGRFFEKTILLKCILNCVLKPTLFSQAARQLMSCFNSVQRCRGALRNARAYDHAAPNAPKHAFLQLNAYVLYEGCEHVIWGLYVCQQAFQSDLHFCGGCSIHNADENERSLMNSEYFHKKSFSTRRKYTTVTFMRCLTFN